MGKTSPEKQRFLLEVHWGEGSSELDSSGNKSVGRAEVYCGRAEANDRRKRSAVVDVVVGGAVKQ